MKRLLAIPDDKIYFLNKFKWRLPNSCARVEGKIFTENDFLHSGIVSAADFFSGHRRFKIFNITKDGFDWQFIYNEHDTDTYDSTIIHVLYCKYTIIDDVLYERDEHEIAVFQRKDKLKKLNNKYGKINI